MVPRAERPLARYGTAVVAIGLAFLLCRALSGIVSSEATYIAFYPAVMLVAVLGGFWPGVFATGVATLLADVWLLPPIGRFGLPSTPDAIGLGLFFVMGVLMSGIAGVYHRSRRRAAECEKELALQESQQQEMEEQLQIAAQFPEENPNPVLRIGRDGGVLFANQTARELLAVQGWKPGEAAPRALAEPAEASFTGGQYSEFELAHEGRVFSFASVPLPDKGYANLYGRDITARKRAENEREITIEFLQLVNESRDTSEMVRTAAVFFQKQSGCGAVGIRLAKGDDYPYFEARGFPEEFVLAESSLCTRDLDGQVVRDNAGYPIMECMCGNVIQGRFDPSKPYFTQHGSFWTNGTTQLLATTADADRQARTRNMCNGEGYESVALMPLHVGNERLGLLQLNDRRKGLFSAELVAQWERFADYLAVALAKFRAEEALQESEDRYRALVEPSPVAILVNRGNRIVFANPAALELFGASRAEQLLGKSPFDLFHADYYVVIGERIAALLEGTPAPLIEEKIVRMDGTVRDVEVAASPFVDQEGSAIQIILHDITDRKQAEQELREVEAHKRAFYRQTILAATEGKLMISEPDEIEQIAGALLGEWQISRVEDVAEVRAEVTSLARDAGMDESRVYDLVACVVESSANAAKHAGGGHASLYRHDHALLFVASDSGPGIGDMRLPDVALTKGYTTAGTLGMGYKVMISFADRVYLATGPGGTTVAAEMRLHVDPQSTDDAAPLRLSAWET